jgi:hypothetical protein
VKTHLPHLHDLRPGPQPESVSARIHHGNLPFATLSANAVVRNSKPIPLGRRANSELQPVPDRETAIKYITVLTLVTQ